MSSIDVLKAKVKAVEAEKAEKRAQIQAAKDNAAALKAQAKEAAIAGDVDKNIELLSQADYAQKRAEVLTINVTNMIPVTAEEVKKAWKDYAKDYVKQFDKKYAAYLKAADKLAADYMELVEMQNLALKDQRYCEILSPGVSAPEDLSYLRKAGVFKYANFETQGSPLVVRSVPDAGYVIAQNNNNMEIADKINAVVNNHKPV